jgi:hypothetical protein
MPTPKIGELRSAPRDRSWPAAPQAVVICDQIFTRAPTIFGPVCRPAARQRRCRNRRVHAASGVKRMDNQTHDEQSISGGEQWRSGYEQLSWQARYSTVTI